MIAKGFGTILSKGIIFIPLLSLFVSYNFAKLYFDKTMQGYDVVMIALLVIAQLLFIFLYLKELYDVLRLKSGITNKINLFTIIVIHIVQLFVNIYLVVLAIDHSALETIVAETPLELLFDITYFSVMTFVGGEGVLLPRSRWIQGIAMLESLMLPIYISIVLFGLYGVRNTIENTEQGE